MIRSKNVHRKILYFMPFWIYFHRPYYQNIVPLRATIFYHKNLLLPYFLYFKKWSYQRHNIKISFLVQLFLLNAWLIMTLCLLIGCGKLFFSVLRGGLHVSKNLCHLNLLISARIYQAYRSHNKDEVARPSCKTSLQGIFFTAFLFNLNLLHSHNLPASPQFLLAPAPN